MQGTYTPAMHAPLGTPASRRVRRLLAGRLLVATCSVALLGSALAAAPAAPAAVARASGAAGTEGYVVADNGFFGFSDATGERCETDILGPLQLEEIVGDGRKVRVSDSQTRTMTAPGDAADTTSVSFRSTASGSVRQSGGFVRSFAVDSSAEAVADSARGAQSDCAYEAAARADVYFTGPFRPGFLRLALDLSGPGAAVAASTNGPGFADSAILSSTTGELTYDLYLVGGDHRIDLTLEAAVYRPDATSSRTRAASTLEARGRTTGLGGSWGRATGPGRSQVALPAARSCPSGTVTARLTRKVRNARRVVVSVDGKRRAVVKRPRPGAKVVVRRAPGARGITVTATITRTSGKVLTASREYAPCSG